MAGQQPEAPAVSGVTRDQLREMVAAAIEKALWDAGSPPASEAVLEVVWPLLERAQADGAKLAEVAAHCRGHLERAGAERGSVCCPHLAEDILAIAQPGSDEEPGDGG